MWVGRATVFMVGLAVILALIFGAASMAFAANGQPFLLGRATNFATALTKLTGNVNGSAMQVVNSNSGADDTALALSVQAGEAPMRVNSATKVANLNADRVDDREASSFANGVGGVATNADKLDNNDSAAFQRRVSGQCAAGSSIRTIGADGTTVACETDDDLSGDAAGGDLTGTYPNPQIAQGAVRSAEVDDGHLDLQDVTESVITFQKDPDPINAGRCGFISVPVDPADGYDSGDFTVATSQQVRYDTLIESKPVENNMFYGWHVPVMLCNMDTAVFDPPQVTLTIAVFDDGNDT
jgi:hypothetical protein